MTHRLFVSTRCMTGFTQVLLPLVSDYLRVLHARQDSLTNTKLHNRSYLWVFSTCQQSLTSSVLLMLRAQRTRCLQNFLRHDVLLAFFVNLDVSCTVWLFYTHVYRLEIISTCLETVWEHENKAVMHCYQSIQIVTVRYWAPAVLFLLKFLYCMHHHLV